MTGDEVMEDLKKDKDMDMSRAVEFARKLLMEDLKKDKAMDMSRAVEFARKLLNDKYTLKQGKPANRSHWSGPYSELCEFAQAMLALHGENERLKEQYKTSYDRLVIEELIAKLKRFRRALVEIRDNKNCLASILADATLDDELWGDPCAAEKKEEEK